MELKILNTVLQQMTSNQPWDMRDETYFQTRDKGKDTKLVANIPNFLLLLHSLR